MSKPYQRGRSFEYRVRDHFKHQGFFVVRQAKSAFPDLICLRQGQILLVECKVNGYLSPSERTRLIAYAKQVGGKAWIAYREGKTLKLRKIKG